MNRRAPDVATGAKPHPNAGEPGPEPADPARAELAAALHRVATAAAGLVAHPDVSGPAARSANDLVRALERLAAAVERTGTTPRVRTRMRNRVASADASRAYLTRFDDEPPVSRVLAAADAALAPVRAQLPTDSDR